MQSHKYWSPFILRIWRISQIEGHPKLKSFTVNMEGRFKIIYCKMLLFALQLFVVDRVDIGLFNVTDAQERRRLNETITQLADVTKQGLAGTVGNFRFHVASLRQCASGNDINDGCSNGTVLATV